MQHPRKAHRSHPSASTLASLLAALLLVGCAKDPNAVTLSTHEVPPARAEAIASAINATLNQNEAPALGRAEVAAPGMLVVRAPASLQPSIGEAIRTLEGTASAEPVQLQVEAWWVTEAEDAAPLPAALDEVAATLGVEAGRLRLRDRVDLGLATGRNGSVNGTALFATISAQPDGDAFMLQVVAGAAGRNETPDRAPMRYDGSVRARPGELIVLASRPSGEAGLEALVLRVRTD